jgi:hypothetical protein
MRGAPLWFALVLTACGGGDAKPDAPSGEEAVDPCAGGDPLKPKTLACTGLCANAECTEISPDAVEYAPHFELWSDGATKKRWISLPPGTQIDTSDMDYWNFPVGTKLWKEFTRDGTRVETRYITKLLPTDTDLGSWHMVSYQWTSPTETMLVDVGGVVDANGTPHNIPSREDCRTCHDSLQSRALGFGAIQLDFNSDKLDLEDLITQGKLTAPPTTGTAGARFALPGSPTVQSALGYMHANCGHCHNPTSVNFADTPTNMRLLVGTLGSETTTPPYTTLVDKTGKTYTHDDGMVYSLLIDSGNADNSILIRRMQSTNDQKHMPNKGSEVIDDPALTMLTTWINGLP